LTPSGFPHYKVDEYPETPGIPGQTLLPTKEGDGVDSDEQSKYRTGVWKLLYLVKWSRPDIANSVRELSRHMKSATPADYKAMERAMFGHYVSGSTLEPKYNLEW
jgi:hypothetical protein